ncbi:MAG: peptidylprolyl isomerase [Clostridia bacterium]|nr:peptidylprolyl isomerase [Clostridia bacterium]
MLAGIQAKDEEVRKYFDEHKEQFTGQPTVNASHILVAEEEKAKEIMGRIESGEITFEEAAHQYSTCPSAQQGGNLGEFGQGQMVPEFDKACFSMEPGELRGPVKTDFGWHIIRLNSKSQSEDMKFEDIAPQLKQQLTIEKQQAAYQSKINQLKILYPVNKV